MRIRHILTVVFNIFLGIVTVSLFFKGLLAQPNDKIGVLWMPISLLILLVYAIYTNTSDEKAETVGAHFIIGGTAASTLWICWMMLRIITTN